MSNGLLGGRDIPVVSTGGNGLDRWRIGGRDFITGKGKPVRGGDGLLPIGQRFVDHLTTVNACLAALRDPENPRVLHDYRRPQVERLQRAANAAVDFIVGEFALLWPLIEKDLTGTPGGTETARQAWLRRCSNSIERGTPADLEHLFFGHNRSIKNTIHMAVRKRASNLAEVFGNLELADAALGRISPGLPVAVPGEAEVDPAPGPRP